MLSLIFLTSFLIIISENVLNQLFQNFFPWLLVYHFITLLKSWVFIQHPIEFHPWNVSKYNNDLVCFKQISCSVTYRRVLAFSKIPNSQLRPIFSCDVKSKNFWFLFHQKAFQLWVVPHSWPFYDFSRLWWRFPVGKRLADVHGLVKHALLIKINII